jgi:hypothetical protein
MTWDDDDFGFDDELSDEEREELDKKNKRRKKHPLILHAKELLSLANALHKSMDEDEQQIQGDHIMQSALMMNAKLAGAIGSDSWLVCMQNAALVRYHANDLLIASNGLEMFTTTHADHIRHFRAEMEKFRDLFVEWAKEIHAMEPEEYIDEWGLFLHPRQLL